MKRNIWGDLLTWKNKKDRKPLILLGARQVGKTYIITRFGQKSFQQYHCLNFEKDHEGRQLFAGNLSPKKILEALSFHLQTDIDVQNDLLFLDEIQAAPRALTSLKYFQEELPQMAICAAGSLIGVHLFPESFPVGKVEFAHLYPMSFYEFLLAIGDERSANFLASFSLEPQIPIPDIIHAHLWEMFKKYLVVGGLPEAVLAYQSQLKSPLEAFHLVRQIQERLILAYNADIAKHSGKLNAMEVDRLWRNIPAQLAREQDGSASKFVFKEVIPGKRRFSKLSGSIDWLVTAGLIIKTPITHSGMLPLQAYSKENEFKLYLFDVGILGALSELPPASILRYDYGSYKGYIAENVVAQEFLASGANKLFCWREGRSEVEFLREYNGVVYPIEVKSGWVTRSKSLNVFAGKYKSPRRTIFSAHNMAISQDTARLPLYLACKFSLIPKTL